MNTFLEHPKYLLSYKGVFGEPDVHVTCGRCGKTWTPSDERTPSCIERGSHEPPVRMPGPPATEESFNDYSDTKIDALDEDFSLEIPEDGGFGKPKFTPEEQHIRSKIMLHWVKDNHGPEKARKFFPCGRAAWAEFDEKDDIAVQNAIMETYLVCIDPITDKVITQQAMNERGYVPGKVAGSAPTNLPDMNPKTRMGALKVPLHLVPPSVMHALAEAFEDGAVKYGPMNYRDEAVSASVYYAALLRHIFCWWDGEDVAADSRVDHRAHALACLAILIDAESVGKLNDDRPFKGASGELQSKYMEKKKDA